jgi:AcrR family transcriptional regulator
MAQGTDVARRGRPRRFDKEEALRRAMEIFWALGYEGATLIDLQEAMGGITAPSFYAAFGSKENLFREAVELYKKTHGAPMMRALTEGPTARESVEAMLSAAVESFTRPNTPHGCMLMSGAINCMRANREVEDHLRDMRSRRQRIIRRRLRRGVTEGDLPPGLDLTALASFYITVLDGLSSQARDGASRKTLKATVNCAMAAWDNLVAARSPDQS